MGKGQQGAEQRQQRRLLVAWTCAYVAVAVYEPASASAIVTDEDAVHVVENLSSSSSMEASFLVYGPVASSSSLLDEDGTLRSGDTENDQRSLWLKDFLDRYFKTSKKPTSSQIMTVKPTEYPTLRPIEEELKTSSTPSQSPTATPSNGLTTENYSSNIPTTQITSTRKPTIITASSSTRKPRTKRPTTKKPNTITKTMTSTPSRGPIAILSNSPTKNYSSKKPTIQLTSTHQPTTTTIQASTSTPSTERPTTKKPNTKLPTAMPFVLLSSPTSRSPTLLPSAQPAFHATSNWMFYPVQFGNDIYCMYGDLGAHHTLPNYLKPANDEVYTNICDCCSNHMYLCAKDVEVECDTATSTPTSPMPVTSSPIMKPTPRPVSRKPTVSSVSRKPTPSPVFRIPTASPMSYKPTTGKLTNSPPSSTKATTATTSTASTTSTTANTSTFATPGSGSFFYPASFDGNIFCLYGPRSNIPALDDMTPSDQAAFLSSTICECCSKNACVMTLGNSCPTAIKTTTISTVATFQEIPMSATSPWSPPDDPPASCCKDDS